jgi:hypothetical protein
MNLSEGDDGNDLLRFLLYALHYVERQPVLIDIKFSSVLHGGDPGFVHSLFLQTLGVKLPAASLSGECTGVSKPRPWSKTLLA